MTLQHARHIATFLNKKLSERISEMLLSKVESLRINPQWVIDANKDWVKLTLRPYETSSSSTHDDNKRTSN